MSVTRLEPLPHVRARLDEVVNQLGRVILGKERTLRQAFACVLARGHLLIEDLPGVGKTTLAHALARVLGLQFQRIQFTSDLLPADILGVSVYDRATAVFEFHPGPVFSQIVLADEVNRATPKAQSALLEAMEEHQVTIEGQTRPLPEPFYVVATQNPAYQLGTFPLPESQLDRFLMKVSLGYPDAPAERALLVGEDRRQLATRLPAVLAPAQVIEVQKLAADVHVAAPILDYLQALLAWSRSSGRFRIGLSPRAGLGLVQCSRAWALLHGRGHVLPDDVQQILEPVAGHRLTPADEHAGIGTQELVEDMLAAVPVPT